MFSRLAIKALLVLSFSLVGCVHQRPHFQGKTEAEKFNHFLDWSFDMFIERQPEVMTDFGIDKKQDQLNDRSFEFDKQTNDLAKQHLAIFLIIVLNGYFKFNLINLSST